MQATNEYEPNAVIGVQSDSASVSGEVGGWTDGCEN